MKNLLIFCFFCFFYINTFATEHINLVDRSPFCRHKNASLCATNQSDRAKNFELHGIWSCDGKYIFSIHDKNTGRNRWVALGDDQNEISVKNFYPEDKVVEIAMPDGESCLLKLQSAEFNQKNFNKFAKTLPIGQAVDDDARERFLSVMNGKKQR